MLRRYRVVIAKPGLDGHDRGAKVIARALRDAGFEVVYTGLFQTAELVAEAALQEDADAVGLSVLSGAHMTLIPKIVDELRARDLADVLVFAGGIIPDEDRPALAAAGVSAVFTPGAPFGEIEVRGQRGNKEDRFTDLAHDFMRAGCLIITNECLDFMFAPFHTLRLSFDDSLPGLGCCRIGQEEISP